MSTTPQEISSSGFSTTRAARRGQRLSVPDSERADPRSNQFSKKLPPKIHKKRRRGVMYDLSDHKSNGDDAEVVVRKAGKVADEDTETQMRRRQAMSIEKLRPLYPSSTAIRDAVAKYKLNPGTGLFYIPGWSNLKRAHNMGVIDDWDLAEGSKVKSTLWDVLQEEIIEQALVIFAFPIFGTHKYPSWEKINNFLRPWRDELQALA